MKRFRLTPFSVMILFFLVMLLFGIWLLVLGLQPPAITHSLPYTV